MQKMRLIGTAIALLILLFTMFPIPSIFISVVCIFSYVCFTYFSKKNVVDSGTTSRRKAALYAAKAFLGHYDDIWSNLKLSNQYCYISMIDEMTIIGVEKKPDGGDYRTFKVVKSNVHDWIELWNMFCINFSYNKTYDGLIEDCRRYNLVVDEKIMEMPEKQNIIPAKIKPEAGNLVDINNASEEEIAALPGISVIMAKKSIKKREEIDGFKNINEFFAFLKIKPHMQDQLINLICVNKIKNTGKIERFQERKVDL